MSVYFFGEEDRLSDFIKDPDVPTQCPVCRHTMIVNAYLIARTGYVEGVSYSEVLFQCVNPRCNSLFIGKYADYNQFTEIYETVPKMVEFPEISEDIKAISSEFVSIYTQSLNAEKKGLDKVCGIGYRKALEFLVKDYLKYHITDDSKYTIQQIETTALRNCIKQWIENPKIKMVAEKATILGNDETHYVRRWVDKDITDLKALIKLTLNYIQMELEYMKYENEIIQK